MKLAHGPRPWAVRLFSIIIVLPALWNFAAQLINGSGNPEFESATYRIAIVSVLSAQLLVTVIPVAAVWFLASRIARWFIAVVSTGFLGWTIWLTLSGDIDAIWLAMAAPTHLAFLLLFTNGANEWFKRQRTRDAIAFE